MLVFSRFREWKAQEDVATGRAPPIWSSLFLAHTTPNRRLQYSSLNDNFFDIRRLTVNSHDAGTLQHPPYKPCQLMESDNFPEPKVLPHQAEACPRAKAEPSHSPVDSPEDQQHHQVRLPVLFSLGPSNDIHMLRNEGRARRSATVANRNLRYNAKRRHWRKTRLGI
jgi:hypothetical protein